MHIFHTNLKNLFGFWRHYLDGHTITHIERETELYFVGGEGLIVKLQNIFFRRITILHATGDIKNLT